MPPADLFDLTGKVALVTGANSGIGLGMATGVAKCGADVVIWGRRAEQNEEAAEKLRGHGVKVLAQQVDVTQEDQVVKATAEAIEEMGRLDCVMPNAGFADVQPSFHEMSTDAYNAMLAVAQHGGFFTMREGIKHMKVRVDAGEPGGSIIICGSLSVFLGIPGMQHYAAAKGALASMMRSIAVEYGKDGIRANMVAFGLIWTGLMAGITEDDLPMTAEVRKRQPIPRWGYPEDCEGIAAYLMSDAAKFHTGDLIVVDGGQSILTIS